MKKLIKAIFLFIIIIVLAIFAFSFSYKLKSEDFITDRTTFIYNNQNINKKNLEKIEKTFNLKKIKNKECLEKIKDVTILSQWRISDRKFEIVGIVDTGLYYPVIYKNFKKYFNYIGEDFYRLKDEYKNSLGSFYAKEIYALPYRGLFFLSPDKNEIKKIVEGSKNNKPSIESIKNINNNKNNLGMIIFNQEREKTFDINRVIINGNMKNDKIYLDSEVYGENEIIKKIEFQPKTRELNRYIGKNTLYLSTKKIKDLDTFLLNRLSFRWDNSQQSRNLKRFFRADFNELSPNFNGEMLIDLLSGSYLFGLENEKIVEVREILSSDMAVNMEEQDGEAFILVGKNSFSLAPRGKEKEIEKNQFLFCDIDAFYGKINVEGYYGKDKLIIKSIIDIKK